MASPIPVFEVSRDNQGIRDELGVGHDVLPVGGIQNP